MKELMNVNNLTRDLILLDLYRKETIFYFNPSSVFLTAINASIVINLFLNKKISIKDNKIKIIDEESIRTYNKLIIDYIKDNEYDDLSILAQRLFVDNDIMEETYNLLIKELLDEDVIEINNEKKFIFNKHIIKLKKENSVRDAYQKLYKTIHSQENSLEFVALTILLDAFFDIEEYFDEEQYSLIIDKLQELKDTEIFKYIDVFKKVVDEFYQLNAQRNSTMWF